MYYIIIFIQIQTKKMPAVDSLPQLASFIFLILYSLLRFYHLRLPNSTHGQTNPLFVQIHADDFYIHNISYADSFQRMFDIFVTDLGNVYQTILVYTNIYEAPKSITFLTVPFKIIPSFRSFISSTSERRIGFGISSRGSRPGRPSSLMIS